MADRKLPKHKMEVNFATVIANGGVNCDEGKCYHKICDGFNRLSKLQNYCSLCYITAIMAHYP